MGLSGPFVVVVVVVVVVAVAVAVAVAVVSAGKLLSNHAKGTFDLGAQKQRLNCSAKLEHLLEGPTQPSEGCRHCGHQLSWLDDHLKEVSGCIVRCYVTKHIGGDPVLDTSKSFS